MARQIEGVRHCVLEPVHRRVPEPGPIVFARGIGITLTVDERAFPAPARGCLVAYWNGSLPGWCRSTALPNSPYVASSAAKSVTGRREWGKGR